MGFERDSTRLRIPPYGGCALTTLPEELTFWLAIICGANKYVTNARVTKVRARARPLCAYVFFLADEYPGRGGWMFLFWIGILKFSLNFLANLAAYFVGRRHRAIETVGGI